MEKDNLGRIILDEDKLFKLISTKGISSFDNLVINKETVDKFNQAVLENRDDIQLIKFFPDEDMNLFDEANQCSWFMPENYFPNLIEFLYESCNTAEQKNRVDLELKLFIQHGMFDLLFYLKYLVDTMRNNNIVWGVGRGSSVSSYVLYLIGIHKIDSLKYKLDINEFLK